MALLNKFLLLCSVPMVLLTINTAYADEVTLVADRYYPYNGIPNSPMPGYMIELAEYALVRAGHTVKYQLMSWDKAIELVAKGEKNCLVATYKNDADNLLFPAEHQGVDRLAFYRRADSQWQFTDVSSLAKQRLGVIDGYDYRDDIGQYIQQYQDTDRVLLRRGKFSLEYNLRALVNVEIDIIIESVPVVTAALQKLKLQGQVVPAGFLNHASKSYIACSPVLASSAEYVALISDATQQLRASGELQVLLRKYGLEDWVNITAVDE